MRLDDLSHILAWAHAPVADGTTADPNKSTGVGGARPAAGYSAHSIELPRLFLTFRARAAADGTVRLLCEQHEGYFVSSRRSPEIGRLLDGVPHSLLLERDDGALSVLVSAGARPRRIGSAGPNAGPGAHLFPSVLKLECANEAWLANLGPTRHYMCAVHLSGGFLFYPTLAAALYMLLLRLLARQYEAVGALASHCVCDSALTAEESQICAMLGQANDDRQPDAHACRLLVSLNAMHTPLEAALPWSLRTELALYGLKADLVAAPLRLAAFEELLLLDHVDAKPKDAKPKDGEGSDSKADGKGAGLGVAAVLAGELAARRRVLKAALSAPGDGEFSVGLPLPTPPPPSASFDAVRDESCVHEQGISLLVDKFTTLSYSRPESMVGLAAVQALDRWLKHGIELRGGRDEKGFLFLYELMRGDLLFKLLPSDSEHTLGAMLLRSLPPSDFQVTSQTRVALCDLGSDARNLGGDLGCISRSTATCSCRRSARSRPTATWRATCPSLRTIGR